MDKKVIFVGGSSYSGSTMLDMMLANSTDGFSVGEVHALFRPYRPHHFQPLCGCGNSDCNIWTKIRNNGEVNLYSSIFNEYPDTQYIVDSSKNPFWINQQMINLSQQGIEAHHLLIWKNPVDFSASMVKRNRKGAIKAWISYHRLYLTLINNFTSISYPDLAQNPSTSLELLCNTIGITYRSGMEDYWNKQHHTLFGNDTAKIHLSNTTDNFKIEDTKHSSSSPKENNSDYETSHRSIYYNEGDKLVPEELKSEINANPLIKNIIDAISSDDAKKTTEHNNCKYSHNQLKKIELIATIKRKVGLIIGKYIRIM